MKSVISATAIAVVALFWTTCATAGAPRCPGTTTILDPNSPDMAAAERGRGLIILNPRMLSREPTVVRRFAFAHECGHHRNDSSNELAADCFAVRQGKRDGWLRWEDLAAVCASWGGAPESATHPSAARRCANLNRCFNG